MTETAAVSNVPSAQRFIRSLNDVGCRFAISNARVLGISTIAEAVRGAADVQLLKQLGVGFGQGYHLGRPHPSARLLRPSSDTRAA